MDSTGKTHGQVRPKKCLPYGYRHHYNKYTMILLNLLLVTRAAATPGNLCCEKHRLAYLFSLLQAFDNSHRSRKNTTPSNDSYGVA